ncbi:tyrosine-type recombinase/integrase [Bacteroidota bacterium]
MAIKVKLRQKPITGERQSLYLDFYPAIPHPETRKLTRREFLGLYIFDKPKTPFDKQHNKETLDIAQHIRQKRENLLNKPEVYYEFEKKQLIFKKLSEKSFIDYFKKLANKRKASNHDNWVSTLNYLEEFVKTDIKFADVNEIFINDFKEYLLSTISRRHNKKVLSQNTASSYFNKLKATLKQAFKDGYLQIDINSKIPPIKTLETQKEYLTLEELNKLVKTPCSDPVLKNAALYSVLTGLRFCDIQKLLWSEVEHIKGQGYFIKFKQKKTQGVEVLPISEQAYTLMGEKRGLNEKVFDGLRYSSYHTKCLRQWIDAAEINKNITFHCLRHTYAVLQLAHGTDIYTVSKMLGHRDLKTTQIYAKIVDKSKRDAVDRIILDM